MAHSLLIQSTRKLSLNQSCKAWRPSYLVFANVAPSNYRYRQSSMTHSYVKKQCSSRNLVGVLLHELYERTSQKPIEPISAAASRGRGAVMGSLTVHSRESASATIVFPLDVVEF
jgi:hypothetical protein